MKITYPGSKGKLEISGKGLITSLGFRAKVRPHKYKKARYAIVNVSKEDCSKIISKFEKLPNESYESNKPKHEPTDSYFYLSRQLAKCMMRAHALNSHVYPVRTEITALSSHVCSADESELKEFLVNETLLQICSADNDLSKGVLVNDFSTEEGKSECSINKQKDANKEVTYDVPSYFNVFECGRNILDRLDVSYERACMANVRE